MLILLVGLYSSWTNMPVGPSHLGLPIETHNCTLNVDRQYKIHGLICQYVILEYYSKLKECRSTFFIGHAYFRLRASKIVYGHTVYPRLPSLLLCWPAGGPAEQHCSCAYCKCIL